MIRLAPGFMALAIAGALGLVGLLATTLRADLHGPPVFGDHTVLASTATP